jgi:hypothetical protein
MSGAVSERPVLFQTASFDELALPQEPLANGSTAPFYEVFCCKLDAILRRLSVPRPRPVQNVRHTEDCQACTPSQLSVALICGLYSLKLLLRAGVIRFMMISRKCEGCRARLHAFDSRDLALLTGKGPFLVV